jgi:hypothetical protein
MEVKIRLQTMSMAQIQQAGLLCDGENLEATLRWFNDTVVGTVSAFGKQFFGE